MLTSRIALPFAALAVSFALALSPTVARADVVSPPPTDCPDGTKGQSCHGGSFCQADTCTTDADCGSGKVCQARSLCAGTIGCGGFLPPDATPPHEPTAGPVCSTSADCDSGKTCATQSVCVSLDSTVVHGGCSCEAAGAGRGPVVISLAGLIVGAAGALARRSKRGQRPSAQRRA